MSYQDYGMKLPNGSTIIHGEGANIKHPFTDIPVVMHELDAGAHSFAGSLGFIEFSTEHRLPRHVHITESQTPRSKPGKFVRERIFVLEGMALVQLNDEMFVIPPKTLVTIAPGVPHTWTACPRGVTIVEGTTKITSEGKFLMLYEYEAPTAFFPTKQTHTMQSVEEYERCHDLDSIRIPLLTARKVHDKCPFAWGRTLTNRNMDGTIRE